MLVLRVRGWVMLVLVVFLRERSVSCQQRGEADRSSGTQWA
jgi:hypothetical protein